MIHKVFRFAILISCLLAVISCEQSTPNTEMSRGIVIQWKLNSIQLEPSGTSRISTTITNNLDVPLTSDNWSIFYNHVGGQVDPKSLPGEITITNSNGDLFELKPTASFSNLPVNESRTFTYHINGFLDKQSEAPNGMFIVVNGQPQPVQLEVEGIDESTLSSLNPTTAATRFRENERLSKIQKEDLLPFIPRPASYQYLSEQKILGQYAILSASEGLENEIKFLEKGLSKLGIAIKHSTGEPDILIAMKRGNDSNDEAYEMRIDQSGIYITAQAAAGIFYGVQSLLQYLEYAKLESSSDQMAIRGIDVQDKPRFGYRGMHLDVSRNFHSKKSVLQLLDAISFFKINKFHFHVTDDEGWRLEIPGLPELTDIGSKRGYTIDEKDHLRPSYGSGLDPNNSKGSGFYTRADFIEILQYANNRHIEVITEIDGPGHARAAIKSMLARHDRLKNAGDIEGANYYRLDDPDDQSQYGSAQNWHDGVMCICREGTYNFMEKVFTEVVAMYQEAGVPLNALHIGGDEMPYGAWQKSPICMQFINDSPELKNSNDLVPYFMKRMTTIAAKFGVTTAGWEEMVMAFNEEGHNSTEIDRALLGQNVLPYVWNAIIGGGRDDMIYKLANAGFKVVMSNSSAFYFDMAYDRDPDEIGLSWSGFANTETAFGTEPLDLFYRQPVDGNGQPLSEEYLGSRVRLTKEGEKNFLGIQSQLWSETIVDDTFIEYLVFPKMLGFAERAWAPKGAWMNETKSNKINEVYHRDWNVFANTIGQKALPILDRYNEGIGYRIPEPGAIVENGRLIANTSFPGLEIKYLEGGETRTYTGPVAVGNKEIMLWSETASGRKGRSAKVK